MWLTSNGEQVLANVCSNNNLSEEENAVVDSYYKFKQVKNLDPNAKGPAAGILYPLNDILKKYANYEDPLEE